MLRYYLEKAIKEWKAAKIGSTWYDGHPELRLLDEIETVLTNHRLRAIMQKLEQPGLVPAGTHSER